ncbi:MAG: hypothetical protein U1F07_00440 [Rubrivivax sp.]
MRQALRETPADHRRGGADAAAKRGSGRLIALGRRIHRRSVVGALGTAGFSARQAAAVAVWSMPLPLQRGRRHRLPGERDAAAEQVQGEAADAGRGRRAQRLFARTRAPAGALPKPTAPACFDAARSTGILPEPPVSDGRAGGTKRPAFAAANLPADRPAPRE